MKSPTVDVNGILDRINELLARENTTERQFAKDIGLSTNTISSWRMHGTAPSVGAIVKVADALDVSTDYLLGRDTSRYYGDSAKVVEDIPEAKEILELLQGMSPSMIQKTLAVVRIMSDDYTPSASFVGERIRVARRRAGLTSTELSKASGVARSTIWKYEQGVAAQPDERALEAIAKALNTTVDCLKGETNDV